MRARIGWCAVVAGAAVSGVALAETPGAGETLHSGSGPVMTLEVDATEVSRRLLHAELTMPATPGPMDVYYVEWTPGNHNPSGPIQNVVNFVVRDDGGRAIEWRRDPRDTVRKSFVVPEGTDEVTLSYSYITNQPSVNSRSTDSYGRASLGVINWNTVLFEPEGGDKDELVVDASIQLPTGWMLASSLPVELSRSGFYDFAPVSFAYLVDSPAIFGEYLATWELESPTGEPHFIDAVAPDPRFLELDERTLANMSEMAAQTQKAFGAFPYRRFHFLTVLDDGVPGAGLEHAESTYISLGSEAFLDAADDGGARLGVFPHEYVHVWNGKLAAPEGLLYRNYHTEGDASLLWVYEGHTSYYDDVLMTRSGMMTREAYEDALASRIEHYQHQAGREWKSVLDTASGQRHLREHSLSWQELRRRQDYYAEGALFWMAADATIRTNTDGAKSLDDFTRAFFGREMIDYGTPATYTREDVVEALRAIEPTTDWDAMIREYIERPITSAEHPVTGLLNRTFTYADTPTREQEKDLKAPYESLFERTLGFTVNSAGEVTRVRRGTAADRAGVSYGMTVLGVDGWTFSADRLKASLEGTPETGKIDLVVRFDDKVEGRRIVYREGVKFPRMELREGAADVLGAILQAR